MYYRSILINYKIQQSQLVSKMQQQYNKSPSSTRQARFERICQMLSDQQSQILNTFNKNKDINQKVAKFKKNISNSWQKLVTNIDAQIEEVQIRQNKAQINSSSEDKNVYEDKYESKEEQGEMDEEIQQNMSCKLSGKKGRGKNFKTSHQATLGMMQWLLKNFENPYPTTQDKQKMAKQGGITLTKVNNWFINARERTVKSYFSKCN